MSDPRYHCLDCGRVLTEKDLVSATVERECGRGQTKRKNACPGCKGQIRIIKE